MRRHLLLLNLSLSLLLPSTPLFAANSSFEYIGYGGNRVVSGSMHLLKIDGEAIMFDAGAFYDDANTNAIAAIPSSLVTSLKAIVISHAHSDHIGRLTTILNLGYTNAIYCTEPTRAFLPVMTDMSARLSDHGIENFYYSKRNVGQKRLVVVHSHTDCPGGSKISPANRQDITARRTELADKGYRLCNFCVELDIEHIMDKVKTIPLYTPVNITPNITIEFFNTPHLPGSVMIKATSGKSGKSLLFTGDYGSALSPFLPEQDFVKEANYAIIEGTYGTDLYPITPSSRREFRQYIGDQIKKNQRVFIPAFVLDRTQQILWEISQGMKEGTIPPDTPVKIYGNSVFQINNIYLKEFRHEKYHPFFASRYFSEPSFDNIFTRGTTISKAVPGEISIASSGLVDHANTPTQIRNWLTDPQTTFIFVSYHSPDSTSGKLIRLGRKKTIQINNDTIPIKATVKKFDCFSGHGNYKQITTMLRQVSGLEKVLLVHLDNDRVDELLKHYQQEFPALQFIAPIVTQPIILSK